MGASWCVVEAANRHISLLLGPFPVEGGASGQGVVVRKPVCANGVFLHLSGEAKTVESPVNLGPSEDLHDGHFLLEGAVVLGA